MLVIAFFERGKPFEIVANDSIKYFGQDNIYVIYNVNNEIFVGINEETLNHTIYFNANIDSRHFIESPDGTMLMQLHESDYMEFIDTNDDKHFNDDSADSSDSDYTDDDSTDSDVSTPEFSLRVLHCSLAAQHAQFHSREE
jgi:hypothetical protein